MYCTPMCQLMLSFMFWWLFTCYIKCVFFLKFFFSEQTQTEMFLMQVSLFFFFFNSHLQHNTQHTSARKQEHI